MSELFLPAADASPRPCYVHFGAVSEPLRKQFPGLRDAAQSQRKADAITLLYVSGILTDSETHKARKRLLKSLKQGTRPRPAAGKKQG